MEIKELEEHCERQLDRLPKTSKGYEEHLLTLAIIKTNRIYFNELDKKDKQIDLYIEELICNEFDRCCQECCKECEKDKDTLRNCIKQYFERKVEDVKKAKTKAM